MTPAGSLKMNTCMLDAFIDHPLPFLVLQTVSGFQMHETSAKSKSRVRNRAMTVKILEHGSMLGIGDGTVSYVSLTHQYHPSEASPNAQLRRKHSNADKEHVFLTLSLSFMDALSYQGPARSYTPEGRLGSSSYERASKRAVWEFCYRILTALTDPTTSPNERKYPVSKTRHYSKRDVQHRRESFYRNVECFIATELLVSIIDWCMDCDRNRRISGCWIDHRTDGLFRYWPGVECE